MVKFMYGYPHINAIFIIQKKLLNNEYITMKEHMILAKTEDLIHEYLENEELSIFQRSIQKNIILWRVINIWIIISIILALNSMWLLKLNKDLVELNEELIATIVIKDMQKED